MRGRFAVAGRGGSALQAGIGPRRLWQRQQMRELSGLPGLLYAAQTAGAAALTVVTCGADTADVESLVRLVHGNHRHPVVRVCQVPAAESLATNAAEASSFTWWAVYQDEHVIVHASHVQQTDSAHTDVVDDDDDESSSSAVYLYTFQSLLRSDTSSKITAPGNSLLILPERMSTHARHRTIDRLSPSRHNNNSLPIVGIPDARGQNVEHRATLLAAVVIQPETAAPSTTLSTNKTNWYSFTTPPPNRQQNGIDPGLLVRAQRQTLAWRRHCSAELLKHFPFKEANVAALGDADRITAGAEGRNTEGQPPNRIRTGCSIVFDVATRDFAEKKDGGTGELSRVRFHHVDRTLQLKQGATMTNQTGQDPSNEGRNSWPDRLKDFLTLMPSNSTGSETAPCVIDEDEIELDDLESENGCHGGGSLDRDVSLLVLGTGCAAPSPYRGASGYALLFPPAQSAAVSPRSDFGDCREEDVVVVLEVGEGFCTQWNRHAEGRPFSSIRLIWISHAHWDHYGGLANLLCQIHQDKQRRAETPVCDAVLDQDAERAKKRGRTTSSQRSEGRANNSDAGTTSSPPPFVVAPPKVLKYLKLLFGDTAKKLFSGILPDDSSMMERGFTSLNSQISRRPFMFWDNIRVDHSCAHAYGCIVGLRRSNHDPPFIFCFSGDTRPSQQLVQACRKRASRHQSRIDFMLHEATFDESEIEMCRRKKHSTVQEALRVGRDVDVCKIMLSHFSQRYDTLPSVENGSESNKYCRRMQVGFAVDGLLVPLFAERSLGVDGIWNSRKTTNDEEKAVIRGGDP